jgi:hypothetical protein
MSIILFRLYSVYAITIVYITYNIKMKYYY